MFVLGNKLTVGDIYFFFPYLMSHVRIPHLTARVGTVAEIKG